MSKRTLTVRGVPDATLERLRTLAEAHRRSLNGELLTILDRAAAESGPASSAQTSPDLDVPRGDVVREAGTAYVASDGQPVDALACVDRSRVAEICRRHHIAWLAVFGSVARGDAHPDSDVDVVVDFEAGRTPGFGFVRVAEALQPAFGGRRVDLVTRNGLSRRTRERVLDSARTLYGAE